MSKSLRLLLAAAALTLVAPGLADAQPQGRGAPPARRSQTRTQTRPSTRRPPPRRTSERATNSGRQLQENMRRSTRRSTDRSRSRSRSRSSTRTAPRGQRALAQLNRTVTRERQRSTLQEIIRRVEAQASQGQTGVVQIDLDLTSLLPVERTRAALREIAARNGEPNFDPTTLEELPGYSSQATRAWSQGPIGSRFPFFRNLGSLDRGEFWNDSRLATDQPNPGLAEFVRAVQAAGGTVVFNSGRFRQSMFEPSRQALERSGLTNINVVEDANNLDPSRINLLIGNPGFSDAGVKRSRQEGIRNRLGRTVAVIDDRIANRSAVVEGSGFSNVMSVGIAIPGFSHDPVTAQQEHIISTFEME